MNTYLITGATSDLGIALIKLVANKEDKFILQGRNQFDSLNATCKELNLNSTFIEADLSNEADIDEFVSKIKNENITHFVHLPALSVVNTKFKNFDEDFFIKDFNVQVLSAVKLSKVILPKMAKNKFGRVLFMATSYVLSNPPKNVASYIMNKSSIVGLMKSLAADYASHSVTVNAVSPSMVQTKFLENTHHLIIESTAQAHPLKRNATVDDVAPAMQFLLSEESRFITGVNLCISGGSVIE